MQAESAPMRWAVITPSYVLDFERCKLLCRSMDRFLTGPWHHYIIVDPVDLPLFRPLAGPRRTVINKKDILPKGFHFGGKVPFMRLGRWWWSFRHGPVFGWQMQQFTKLFMVSRLQEEAMMFCDSDMFFLKPLDVNILGHGHAVRFNLLQSAAPAQNRDIAASIRIMGIDPKDVTLSWGTEQIVTWHRPTALSMLDYISKRHGKPWHEEIGMKLSFAEYHLYSTYVNYVAPNNPHVFYVDTNYCRSLWTREQAAATDLRTFCETLEPQEVAVCVQSRLGADVSALNRVFDARTIETVH